MVNNTITFEMHWTVLSVFNNKMEITKQKVTYFRKSDLVQLLCTTSKTFSILTAFLCVPQILSLLTQFRPRIERLNTVRL